jgi:hypothetical protein
MKTRKSPQNQPVKLMNVADIKRRRTGHLLVHFTGPQWKIATGKLRTERFDSATHGKLPGVDFSFVGPSSSDMGVITFPDPCGNGCVKSSYPDDGFGRCDCPPRTGGSKRILQRPGCNVVVVGRVIRCEGTDCHGSCRVVAVMTTPRTGRLVCRCS